MRAKNRQQTHKHEDGPGEEVGELEVDVTSCQLNIKAGKTWPIGDGINAIAQSPQTSC